MISIPIDEFNVKDVILKENTTNKLIDNSTFCKIMYSNEFCHISGVPLFYLVKNDDDDTFKNNIKIIESSILNLYQPYSKDKKCIHKLYNHIVKRSNKSYNFTSKNTYIITIIGIWESSYEYGITYKITNHP